MVFVWSNLVDGEPHFTLSQVALNDSIMVFAFAPIVALLLGLSSIAVPWDTLILSVVLYIIVPVIVAQLWRRSLLAKGEQPALARTLRALAPLSLSFDPKPSVQPVGQTRVEIDLDQDWHRQQRNHGGLAHDLLALLAWPGLRR